MKKLYNEPKANVFYALTKDVITASVQGVGEVMKWSDGTPAPLMDDGYDI